MLVTRLIVFAALLSTPLHAEEFRPLFNGKNLDGWVAEGQTELKKNGKSEPVWTVEDGKIVCAGSGFGFLRYDGEEFADFVFHVEFRMAPKCNSGLGIRTTVFEPSKTRATRPSYYSYEIQLIDDAGKPPSVHSSGSLYRYVAPKESAMNRAQEWNAIDVECVGPRIKITLNGKEIINVDQREVEALKEKPLKGYVCLQNHGGRIEFRDVRIKTVGTRAR